MNALEKTRQKNEEWIWIDGFKGTDSDMKCRDYQFEPNGTYSIPEEEEVEMCCNGFHLCRDLADVFQYYDVGKGHRFFEVRALVRKSEYDAYETEHNINKLVARTIEFGRELDVDEILSAWANRRKRLYFDTDVVDISNWTAEHKKAAIESGIAYAKDLVLIDELAALGYSKPFAKLIVDKRVDGIAKSVASQDGLSMDMKAMYIYMRIQDNMDRRRWHEMRRAERYEREHAFLYAKEKNYAGKF